MGGSSARCPPLSQKFMSHQNWKYIDRDVYTHTPVHGYICVYAYTQPYVFIYAHSCTRLICVHVHLMRSSVVSNSATLWTVARQGPLSLGFPRQEYWSGLLFPSPGDLPPPGIEPRSSALQVDSLLSEPLGKPVLYMDIHECICVMQKALLCHRV